MMYTQGCTSRVKGGKFSRHSARVPKSPTISGLRQNGRRSSPSLSDGLRQVSSQPVPKKRSLQTAPVVEPSDDELSYEEEEEDFEILGKPGFDEIRVPNSGYFHYQLRSGVR